MAALLKRASDLGEITPRQARTLWMKIGKLGYKVREPVELDIPQEEPRFLSEVVGVYVNDMEYSIHDLGKLLHLHDKEFRQLYLNSRQLVVHNERKAAVEEFERIIKKKDRPRTNPESQ
jgi:hypothetical protein